MAGPLIPLILISTVTWSPCTPSAEIAGRAAVHPTNIVDVEPRQITVRTLEGITVVYPITPKRGVCRAFYFIKGKPVERPGTS